MPRLDVHSAQIYYNQLLEAHEVNEGNYKNAIRDMRLTFESIFKTLTAKELQAFSNLFARTVYVIDTFKLPKNIEQGISSFRKYANKVIHEEGFTVDKRKYLTSIKTIADIIFTLSQETIPEALLELYRSEGDLTFYFEQSREIELVEYAKCTVISISELKVTDSGDKYFQMVCEAEEDIERFTISVWDSGFSKLTELHEFIWVYSTICIINFKKIANRDNFYTTNSKSQIVLVPDYLIDASEISECFQIGYTNPNLFLLGKLISSDSNEAAFKGTLVNNQLDALIREPNKSPDEVFESSISDNALKAAMFGQSKIDAIRNSIKHEHFTNLVKVSKDLVGNPIKIEPTFFSATYGIQGRLDAMVEYKDDPNRKDVFELKSGKAPYGTGVWINNEKQIICYNMLLSSTFGNNRTGTSSIFYSAAVSEQLRNVPSTEKGENEIIALRNKIIDQIFRISRCDYSPLNQINSEQFGSAPPFKIGQIEQFAYTMHYATSLEKTYYLNFLSFLIREHQTAKIGSSTNSGRDDSGFAALWLDSLAEKEKKYNIIYGLKFISFDTYTNSVEFEILNQIDHNFRDGDLGILYPKSGETLTPLKWQILKGSVNSIKSDKVLFTLRNKQIDEDFFISKPDWAIEHDLYESNYWEIVQSLFDFIKSSNRIKDLILGVEKPQTQEVGFQTDSELNRNQNELLQKALEAKDYFLMQGPPGTGKTSTMLIKITCKLIQETKDNIVILAFTNRAVDEICKKLRNNKVNFLRLSSKSNGDDEDFVNRIDGCTLTEIRKLITDQRVFVSTVASFNKRINDLKEIVSVDTLIVDEASQLTEPQIVGLISNFKKFILIGDQNQLPAVVSQSEELTTIKEEVLINEGFVDLSQSLFERLYNRCITKGWTHAYGMLESHYRMHDDISLLLNHYYDNKLNSDKAEQKAPYERFNKNSANIVEVLLAKGRTLFIQSGRTSTTKTNLEEANKVVVLLNAIKQVYGDSFNSDTVGVVTPWRAQIVLIKSKIKDKEILEKVTIDTIERFQGSEKEIIIVSLAVYHTNQLKAMQSVSFDSKVDRKLLVTVSRAKEQLIVLGYPQALVASPYYSDLVEKIRMHNGFVDYRTGMQTLNS